MTELPTTEPPISATDAPGKPWTFLTHHAHLLLAIAENPDARVHELAETVGVSSRAALSIMADLVEAGYIRRERVGRRNHYSLERNRPFRHPSTASHSVDEMIAVFATLSPALPGTDDRGGGSAHRPGLQSPEAARGDRGRGQDADEDRDAEHVERHRGVTTGLGRVEERVGVEAGRRSAHQGIDHPEHRVDQGVAEAVPRHSRSPWRENPVQSDEDRRPHVEYLVGPADTDEAVGDDIAQQRVVDDPGDDRVREDRHPHRGEQLGIDATAQREGTSHEENDHVHQARLDREITEVLGGHEGIVPDLVGDLGRDAREQQQPHPDPEQTGQAPGGGGH
ncbi:ArsR family transcriptional regulator [Cryobacterium breve]|uniref:ArsR family transcriptional regulator n=1 Tax=Cryobacterium breve TaxID=1259258 RepID=A0ABY2IUU3_9MICO|nr:ArsR family transcriptional regulator [Cryobacterium sp. TmT3-12]TFC95388.1 ArsR family transcriptional regulator [Cryobacterium breve]